VATRLALGRATLAAAVEELRRLNEGGGRKGEYDDWSNLGPLLPRAPWERPYDEVLEILHPLAAWFASLLAAGVLRDNDVLCLALDGPLFGLPLQALEVGGVPLGVRFACTVVPSASVLLACAAARNQQPRRRPVAAVVPLASEDEAKARRNLEALGRHAEVELLGGPSADLARIQAAPLSQALLHIAAHGLFDPRDPLRRSGVVLARNGAYPPGRDARSGTLLTPNDLAQLNLLGTHLSFRACVSGRTTEVTSREALGMIWAAFTAGASSIIAGQWDVYIPSAASLLDELYEAAVDQPVLARAYRHALERVRSESPAYAHPYHFCGLAYYGYWR
jgi:CHAT domain-containing protein